MGGFAYNAAEECSEQSLRGKVVAHFFETEQDAADWSTEGNSDSTGGTSAKDLSALAVVIAVLGEDTASNVSNAGRNVYLLTVSFGTAQVTVCNLHKVPPYQDSAQMQHLELGPTS